MPSITVEQLWLPARRDQTASLAKRFKNKEYNERTNERMSERRNE